jgi:SAM-dependent methyltransferase
MTSREAQNPKKWGFPLELPKNTLKRSAKETLGKLLLLARPDIERRIESAGETKSFVEEVALAGLIAKHRKRGTLTDLAHFHAKFWAGENATSFHATHEYRFRENFLNSHYSLVEQLDRVLQENPNLSTLYEIGCGSGLVLEHLAARFTQLRRLVGLDLSRDQIELNRKRFKDPRMVFEAADGSKWLAAHAEADGVLLAYGGVLEYFTQPALEELLQSLASRPPFCIAIAEPVDISFDFATAHQSQPYGSEFSYSHNYPQLAAKAGFQVRWKADIGRRWLLMLAVAHR